MKKIILLLTLLLLVGCTEQTIIGSGEYVCEIDSDCLVATLDPCTCGSGGQQKAINMDFQSSWQNILNEQYTDTTCEDEISDHASCFTEAKCVENTCQLVLDKSLFCSGSNAKTNCETEEFSQYGLSCEEIVLICG
tara:strand:- start:1043 stop:1450 length:408 start_codon:yes stop_codon:yes gene_type:complete